MGYMAVKLVPGCQVYCPLSGVTIDGQIVRPHLMIASRCKGDKSIFLRCQLHMVSGFIAHPVLLEKYLNGPNRQAPTQVSGR